MYNVSEIISRPVLSLFEGEMLGVVDKIYFDKKLKKMLYLELKQNENEPPFVLPVKSVYNVGKNAITIKNNQCVILKESLEPIECVSTPIGAKTYTVQGELLGIVASIEVDDKFCVAKIIMENEKEIDITKLASCTNNTIIIYDDNSSICVSNFKLKKNPNIFKIKTLAKVKTMPIMESVEEPTVTTKMNEILTNPISQPNIILPGKKMHDSSFILNRKTTKDIANISGEIIIKNNTKITQQIINQASKFGKLKELMIFSK